MVRLIITIIVLLILAGVTIATLTGENGLLKRLEQARQKNLDAQQNENTTLSSYENAIDDVILGISREDEVSGISEEQIRKIVGEELDARIANIQVNGIYETVYEGSATATYPNAKTYTLSKDISNYKYLIVYGAVSVGSGKYEASSTIIDMQSYKCCGGEDCVVGRELNADWTWSVTFNFPSNTQITIYDSCASGWEGTPVIYLIKGVR